MFIVRQMFDYSEKLTEKSTEEFKSEIEMENKKKLLQTSIFDCFGLVLNDASFNLNSQGSVSLPWKNNLNWSCYGIMVASAADVAFAKDHCKAFYLPGEFCRQSDAIDALSFEIEHSLQLGKQPHTIYLERGAFLSPADLILAFDKFSKGTQKYVTLVDSGTSFGPGNRILDLNAFTLYKQKTNANIAVNLSHLDRNPNSRYRWQPLELLKAFQSELETVTNFVLSSSNNAVTEVFIHAH